MKIGERLARIHEGGLDSVHELCRIWSCECIRFLGNTNWGSIVNMCNGKVCLFWYCTLFYGSMDLKGKFPQTTMRIGWVESNFTNPKVKVWADLDNPFKRSDYGKVVYVALSGWNSARICDITRGQLSIDFVHRFFFFRFFFLGGDINSPFDQVHS